MCVCSNREELLVNACEKSEHEKRVGSRTFYVSKVSYPVSADWDGLRIRLSPWTCESLHDSIKLPHYLLRFSDRNRTPLNRAGF